MGTFKHQKSNVGQESSKTVDRISNLPDCVIHHILSFLPTKDAVGTSTLSTRWRYLWTSLPNIDFDDMLYFGERCDCRSLETTGFVNFVERVLTLHDMSNVNRFRLSCRVCFKASHVNEWISYAVRQKFQELNLCLFVDEPFTLPPCVFTCESLTVVKIEMNCVLKLPNCISFPHLKILHLRLVTFSDDNSTQKLFSSCPVLQELAIIDCEWTDLKSITISIPTLRSLTIDDLPCFGSMDDINDCEIKIYAANLISLNYFGHLSNDNILYNLSSLVSASVNIPNLYERKNAVALRGVKLLRGLHNVKSVKISNGTIKSFFLAENLLDYFPIFQNLTRLELSMEIEYHSIEALMDLLQSAPNLESLVFAKGLDPQMCLNEDDWNLKPVYKPFLSNLKIVHLQNFHGNDTELFLLNFFLKSASALERMVICHSKKLLEDLKKQKEVGRQLQMLVQGSMGCLIIVQ